MQDEKNMSLYVARLKSDRIMGLGVVVYRHILTCAHFFYYFEVDKLNPLKVNCVLPCEESTDYYVQSMDCLGDFMVLGEAPFYAEIENSSVMPEIDPPIKPVQLIFPADAGHIDLPVYFYAPDGRTVWHTTASVHRDDSSFELNHTVIGGCSGGPVFTEDHRLLGFVVAVCGPYDDQLCGLAVRIDFAAPGWLKAKLGGFDDLHLADYALEEEEPSRATKRILGEWAITEENEVVPAKVTGDQNFNRCMSEFPAGDSEKSSKVPDEIQGLKSIVARLAQWASKDATPADFSQLFPFEVAGSMGCLSRVDLPYDELKRAYSIIMEQSELESSLLDTLRNRERIAFLEKQLSEECPMVAYLVYDNGKTEAYSCIKEKMDLVKFYKAENPELSSGYFAIGYRSYPESEMQADWDRLTGLEFISVVKLINSITGQALQRTAFSKILTACEKLDKELAQEIRKNGDINLKSSKMLDLHSA